MKDLIIKLLKNKYLKDLLLKIINSNKYIESFMLKSWNLFVSHKYQGLFVAHNMDDLYVGDFGSSYDDAFKRKLAHNEDVELIRMRVYNVIKALELAIKNTKNSDTMFVGVAHGFTAFTGLNYFKLKDISLSSVYLVDSFDGSTSLEEKDVKCSSYPTSINSVEKTFSDFNNINFIEGFIPEAIIDFNKKLSFIHVNTGDIKSEDNSLESLWDNLLIGGIMVIDNYAIHIGYQNDYKKLGEINAFRWLLPTGQLMLIKNES
jgi:hypothetical protein